MYGPRTGALLLALALLALALVFPAQANELTVDLLSNNNNNAQLRGSLELEADATLSVGEGVKAELAGRLQASTASPTPGVTIVIPPLDPMNGTNATQAWQELPDWSRYVIGVLACIVGVILTFFGAKYKRVSLFVIGGFVAFIVMYAILAAAVSDSDTHKAAIVYWTSFGAWVFFGTLCIFCVKFASVVFALGLGTILAISLFPIALKYVIPSSPWGNLFMWIAIFAILFGILLYFLETFVLILATSMSGSFLVLAGVSALVGSVTLVFSDMQNLQPTTWQAYAYFGGFCALFLVGFFVQLCVTSRDTKSKGKEA